MRVELWLALLLSGSLSFLGILLLIDRRQTARREESRAEKRRDGEDGVISALREGPPASHGSTPTQSSISRRRHPASVPALRLCVPTDVCEGHISRPPCGQPGRTRGERGSTDSEQQSLQPTQPSVQLGAREHRVIGEELQSWRRREGSLCSRLRRIASHPALRCASSSFSPETWPILVRREMVCHLLRTTHISGRPSLAEPKLPWLL